MTQQKIKGDWINVGAIGHVDHSKSTISRAISNVLARQYEKEPDAKEHRGGSRGKGGKTKWPRR